MKSMIGILAVALIAGLAYKFYFAKMGPSGTSGTPSQVITTVGIESDLLNIAQAERLYQAQHGFYASFDELSSSGALTTRKPSREGYAYSVETSAAGFTVTARCQGSTSCTSYAVDQTMKVHQIP